MKLLIQLGSCFFILYRLKSAGRLGKQQLLAPAKHKLSRRVAVLLRHVSPLKENSLNVFAFSLALMKHIFDNFNTRLRQAIGAGIGRRRELMFNAKFFTKR